MSTGLSIISIIYCAARLTMLFSSGVIGANNLQVLCAFYIIWAALSAVNIFRKVYDD